MRKRNDQDHKMLSEGFTKYGQYKRVYVSARFDVSHVGVLLTVMINADDTLECSVYHDTIRKNGCTALEDVPKVLNDENFLEFAEKFSNMRSCPGNDDFKDIIENRLDFKEPF